ncbi:MAG: hypothetical protein ACK417_01955 [Bacteroidia bacterium]
MRIQLTLILCSLLSLSGFSQKIESVHPLALSNGDTMTAVTRVAQFNNTFLFLSKKKRHIYYGEDLSALQIIDLRDEFFKVFDTSYVKTEGEQVHKIKAWQEDLFFSNFYFLRVGPDIGLFADFVIESHQYEYMLAFHRVIVLLFDSTTFRSKKILFVNLPETEPKPIIRKGFSTPNTAQSPNIFVDVEYADETTLPVLIGLSSPDAPAISFPSSFRLPPNNYRSMIMGMKFNYSVPIGDRTYHLFSNGFEIVDMDQKELFFTSPDSTMILSPILFVENQPCVVVATINMEQMRNSNFRYVSVLDGSYVKDVDHRKLPSFYIHNLTGLSYSEQGPYLGFRNIEGKPHLIHFTP